MRVEGHANSDEAAELAASLQQHVDEHVDERAKVVADYLATYEQALQQIGKASARLNLVRALDAGDATRYSAVLTNEVESFEQILFRLRLYEHEWFVSAGSSEFQGSTEVALRLVVKNFMTDPKIAQWISDLLDQFRPPKQAAS